jgi:anti-sigma regulatory factor (Ser/Thr protein kinase)
VTPVRGPVATGFEHESFLYRSESEFLDGVLAFARAGLAQGEAVVAALPQPRLDLLRSALGRDAAGVELLDMAEVGGNPARIVALWETAVQRHTTAGPGLRGIGEPAYPGRRAAELVECQLHELLLNRAFDGGPPWRLMCPYDERRLSRATVAGARVAHPVVSRPAGRVPSPEFQDDALLGAFAAPLPRAEETVLNGGYGAGDVTAVRNTVAAFARSCGLGVEQVEDLALAATELATNSVRHGGGSGTLAMWRAPGSVELEFTDRGHVADPMTGRRRPGLVQEGGRGVYLVNQLCDLVSLRSSPAGTTVRVTTWV